MDNAIFKTDPDNAPAPTAVPPASKGKVSSLADIPAVAGYLSRIGAEPTSMRSATIKEQDGRYPRIVATVVLKRHESGEWFVDIKHGWGVTRTSEYDPTDAELALIKTECADADWPTLQTLFQMPKLPDKLQQALREDKLFVFKDTAGKITMLQQRVEREDGGKSYLPWTYWDDDQWHQMEPDGDLPLWGIENIKNHTIAFIHEGAKAARAMQRMVEGKAPEERDKLAAHPWGVELSAGVHLGWIGGAPNPDRTDWSVLKKQGIERVYIVADNDEEGRAAVPEIAKLLRIPTFQINFTTEWPAAFDLADEFPDKMFVGDDADRRYIGPTFSACIEPATWATDASPKPKGGRATIKLRRHFAKMWVYANKPELFICRDDTRIIRSADNLSKMLRRFSHTPGTGNLLLEEVEQVVTVGYSPAKERGTVTSPEGRAFNVFRPSTIKPDKEAGPAQWKPWEEFLDYLFPIPAERDQVAKWCATLIAKPEVRIGYGLLLVSEMQGVGKTILATKVLAPLVGDHNVGFPSEQDITTSQFTGWKAHKRLLVFGEIYQGHSWKAYNKLKEVITDTEAEVNIKHQIPYRIENWCHVIACSNSRKALKVDDHDRRWFYPEVTEKAWTREQFEQFLRWLESGGLRIIMRWAEQYGEYVKLGEHAPMSDRKKEIIEASRPQEQQWIYDYCSGRIEEGESFVVSSELALTHAKGRLRSQPVYSETREMGKCMEAAGMVPIRNVTGGEFRLWYANAKHQLFLSPKAVEALKQHLAAAADTASVRKAWLKDQLATCEIALNQGETM